MKSIKFVFFLLVLSLGNFFASSQIIFSDKDHILNIGKSVSILEDKTGKLSFSEALSSKSFIPSIHEVPNFGISNSSFWIKFQIKNSTNTSKLLLRIGHPIMDEVTLYKILPGGNYAVEKMGEYKPFYQRKYNHQDYIFDLDVAKNESRTYFLKIKSGDYIQLPITIGDSQKIMESLLKKDYIFGIYSGIILIMLFYNLCIYIIVKDKSYLYYLVYLLFVGLTLTCEKGYTFRFLWPNSPWLATQSIQLLPAIAGIFLIEFAKTFLQTKYYTPRLHKVFIVLTIVYGVSIILTLIKKYSLSQQLIQLVAMFLSIHLFLVALKVVNQGYRPARFFLIAWGVFLVCVCAFVLNNVYDVLPSSFVSSILTVGSTLEVALISLALGDRIKLLQKEKEESQKKAMQIEYEKKQIVQDTHSKLLKADKLATIGELTAGIGHEINNPINFVNSSIEPLRKDIEEMLLLLDKYDELQNVTTNTIPEKLKEIKQFREHIDISYVKEEITLLLKGIEEGASRTTEIVKGLKEFSHLDIGKIKKTNLHDGIETTLMLLNNYIKNKIKIIKEYSQLPEVECYSSTINQVFMNILSNAIQAIEAKGYSANEGTIKISSSLQNDGSHVVISIEDNGIGIPRKNEEKIFEQFFTTKESGIGTGLGLSITRNIVRNHNGQIKVESEEGKGTTFKIILPLTQIKKEEEIA